MAVWVAAGAAGWPGSAQAAGDASNVLRNIPACLAWLQGGTNTLHPAAVDLTAVVTLVDSNRGVIVLQAEDAAMAVQWRPDQGALRAGQQVRVEAAGVAPYVHAFPAFPDWPDAREWLPTFEAPHGGAYHLARLRGFLHPPTSGFYRFWTTADDAGELWLSTNAHPADARRVAWNRVGNATGPRQWDRYATQTSRPVFLTAGQPCYVEALHIQSYAQGNFAVAWAGPDFSRALVTADHLTPWREAYPGGPPLGEAAGGTNGLLYERWDNFVLRDFEALRPRPDRECFARLWYPQFTPVAGEHRPTARLVTGMAGLRATGNLLWVEAEGIVDFVGGAGDQAQMTLRLEGCSLPVRVLAVASRPEEWASGARARVAGVLEHCRNAGGDWLGSFLWVPEARHVAVREPAVDLEGTTSLVSICEMVPANPRMTWGRRLRVQARVVGRTNDLWLVRGRDHYRAEASADGRDWVPVGEPVEPWMDEAVLVGVALAGRHSEKPAVALFERLSGWGDRWEVADLGRVGQPAELIVTETGLRLTSLSRHIGERADRCAFAYQTNFIGPTEFSARTELRVQPSAQTHFGIMARESLDPRSPAVTVLFAPVTGPALQYRRSTGEPAVGFPARPELARHPWLRLVKAPSLLRVRGATTNLLEAGEGWREITGTLTWQDGLPVLDQARLAPIRPPLVGRSLPAVEAEETPTLAGFVARARHPPEPFFGNRMMASGLRAVVTFCAPVAGTNRLFVQQGDAGLQVAWPVSGHAPAWQPGQFVELGGVATVRRNPVVLEPDVFKTLGWVGLPDPVAYSGSLILAGNGHARWVEARGVVRADPRDGRLAVMTDSGPLNVVVGHELFSAGPPDWTDARVRLRGVLTLYPGAAPEVLVPSPAFLEMVEPPAPDPFVIPRFPLTRVAALEIPPAEQHRVRISGRVTAVLAQGLFVQDESGGAFCQPVPVPPPRVDEAIEMAGFPVREPGGVFLLHARGRPADDASAVPVTPRLLTQAAQLTDPRQAHTLVQVAARLIERRELVEGQSLVVQFGPLVLEAWLPGEAGERLRPLPVGSQLALTGILQNQVPVTPPPGSPAPALRLWLRHPRDVHVLERPPWWTARRLAAAGALLAFGLGAALLWVRVLRRRVAQKTRQLQQAMQRLEQETRTAAILAERDRLAGEIHDGLEQGLTAIMLQLDAAARHPGQPAGALHFIRRARSMAEFSRAEVQHAVWDMQSPLLANASLAAALRHVADQTSSGSPTVQVTVSGPLRPLPSSHEHHLLRIAQEAITNAVKHARARTIRVALDYSGPDVTLTITDDGAGFDPAAVPADSAVGHFGLHGMRARARTIGARLEIRSHPGGGTVIQVQVPNRVTAVSPPTSPVS